MNFWGDTNIHSIVQIVIKNLTPVLVFKCWQLSSPTIPSSHVSYTWTSSWKSLHAPSIVSLSRKFKPCKLWSTWEISPQPHPLMIKQPVSFLCSFTPSLDLLGFPGFPQKSSYVIRSLISSWSLLVVTSLDIRTKFWLKVPPSQHRWLSYWSYQTRS